MLDLKEVTEDYSVYDYQKDARKAIKDITSRGKRVIIVGGTGLYIKAALYDYRFPTQEKKNNYDNYSLEELIEKIKEYNIQEIDTHNRRRLERLLQKLEEGQEISFNKDEALYPHTVIGLTTNRDKLYSIINNRVDKMIENGLLNEINSLKDYYPKSRILNSGIGYKEFNDYLFKDQSLEETIEKVKLNSRRFAKRQYTFFKHQFPTTWYEVNYKDFNKTIELIYNDLKKED